MVKITIFWASETFQQQPKAFASSIRVSNLAAGLGAATLQAPQGIQGKALMWNQDGKLYFDANCSLFYIKY